MRHWAIELTRTFDDFTPDNDSHKERDFGSFEIDDQKFIFKHDSYDKSMLYGSEDLSGRTRSRIPLPNLQCSDRRNFR